MALSFQFRPLPVWPYKITNPRRDSPFDSTYTQTLELLDREINHFRGRDVLMGVGLTEYDIRQDGQPRANARPVGHPGVEISFDAWMNGRRQRISFHSDACHHWQDNVRSIALGMGALRAVDRYGIAETGQQYTGFMALAAGESKESLGARLVEEAGSITAALRQWHPDTNPDPEAARNFDAVVTHRKTQEE